MSQGENNTPKHDQVIAYSFREPTEDKKSSPFQANADRILKSTLVPNQDQVLNAFSPTNKGDIPLPNIEPQVQPPPANPTIKSTLKIDEVGIFKKREIKHPPKILTDE